MALNGMYVDLAQAQIMEAPTTAMSEAELVSAIATVTQHLRALQARLNLLEYERGKRQRLQQIQQAVDGIRQPALL